MGEWRRGGVTFSDPAEEQVGKGGVCVGRRWVGVSAFVGMVFIAAGASLAGDAVRIPGTKVRLQPPPGFTLAGNFTGFESAALPTSSILVTRLPAPAADLMKTVTRAESWASRGITLVSAHPETIDGREGVLLELAQEAGGVEFRKWSLVTGDAAETVMVTGTFPKSAGPEVGAALRSAVLSVTLNAEGSDDPFEGLPFRVSPPPRLKHAGRLSNMLMFNESGKLPDPGRPFYFVGPSTSPAAIEDLRAFAEEWARQSAELKNLRNLSGREITVDGLPAYELLLDGDDEKSGKAERIYQVIVPVKGGFFYFIQGRADPESAAELLPEFRALTASFRRVETPR